MHRFRDIIRYFTKFKEVTHSCCMLSRQRVNVVLPLTTRYIEQRASRRTFTNTGAVQSRPSYVITP